MPKNATLCALQAFSDAKARPWSLADPNGNVLLSVAENRLATELVAVDHVRRLIPGKIPARLLTAQRVESGYRWTGRKGWILNGGTAATVQHTLQVAARPRC